MKHNVLFKTSLVLVCSLFCILPPAKAAEAAATSDRSAAIREHMQEVATKLKLSDEQKEKLRPIIRDELEQLKAIRDDSSLSRFQKLRKAKAVRKEVTPKVKAVLTPEQFEQWQKMRKENRDSLRKRAGQ